MAIFSLTRLHLFGWGKTLLQHWPLVEAVSQGRSDTNQAHTERSLDWAIPVRPGSILRGTRSKLEVTRYSHAHKHTCTFLNNEIHLATIVLLPVTTSLFSK